MRSSNNIVIPAQAGIQPHPCHPREDGNLGSFCHSRAGGNLRIIALDPRLRGDDKGKGRGHDNLMGRDPSPWAQDYTRYFTPHTAPS
jgi:hypothetical protein